MRGEGLRGSGESNIIQSIRDREEKSGKGRSRQSVLMLLCRSSA